MINLINQLADLNYVKTLDDNSIQFFWTMLGIYDLEMEGLNEKEMKILNNIGAELWDRDLNQVRTWDK